MSQHSLQYAWSVALRYSKDVQKQEVKLGNLTGRIVEAQEVSEADGITMVGSELRRLRLLAGMTQEQVAMRMDVQQNTISKIEMDGEIHLSTLQRYVESLGASLRLNAHFSTDAPLSLRLYEEAFDVEQGENDQLVLPFHEDELFKPQRDVVLSIKPLYSEKILAGKKTVELRRRFPIAVPRGTLAYIYSTSPVKAMVGTALIRNVLKLPVEKIWTEFKDTAFIERPHFDEYFDGLDHGFALLFDGLKTFPRHLPLSELREKFGFEPPQSFLYAKRDLRQAIQDEQAIVSH